MTRIKYKCYLTIFFFSYGNHQSFQGTNNIFLEIRKPPRIINTADSRSVYFSQCNTLGLGFHQLSLRLF